MKFNIDNLQLSGKGAIVTDELLHENMRITTERTQFHQLVILEDDNIRPIGWLIPNEYTVDADFIIHSPSGSKGKSTHDTITESILFDGNGLFNDILPDTLLEVDTSESEVILDRLKADRNLSDSKDFNFDGKIDGEGLVILSPKSEFIFVQTDDSSVRIHGKDGVYVLKRNEERDKLVMIDKHDGVNVYGDKSVSIGPGGLIIDGKPLNIEGIVGNVLGAIGSLGSLGTLGNFNIKLDGMEDLSRKMEKIGTKIGKTFETNFKKNFEKNFTRRFDDIMDDFDDDMEGFDVDVEY